MTTVAPLTEHDPVAENTTGNPACDDAAGVYEPSNLAGDGGTLVNEITCEAFAMLNDCVATGAAS